MIGDGSDEGEAVEVGNNGQILRIYIFFFWVYFDDRTSGISQLEREESRVFSLRN